MTEHSAPPRPQRTPLRLLMVEDSDSDRELMLRELGREFAVAADVAETEPEFLEALARAPEAILLDYRLPRFSAVRALGLLRERGAHVPAIVVSGTLSEEAAVECMRLGADDYVMKDRIARLPAAVARAMEARRLREVEQASLAALQAAEERYRTLVETIPAVVYRMQGGRDGRWLYVSPQIQPLLGYTPEEWLADRQLWYACLHPDDRQVVLAEEPASDGGAESQSSYRMLTRDGRTVWVRDDARVSRAEDGTLVYEGVIHDVTATVEAQQTMRRLATILESTDDAAVSFDLDGRITTWNAGAERMLGYSRTDALAMTAEDLIAPDRRPLQQSLFARVAAGETLALYEAEWVDRAGAAIPLSLSASPIRDAAGRVTGVASIARDVSEQKATEAERRRLEHELERSRRLETIGTLAGGIAHDFNNLLAVILNFADLVSEQVEGELREDVLEIKRAGERGAALIAQLLAFTRHGTVESQPVVVDELLAETEPLIRHAVGEHIEVEIVLGASSWAVLANHAQLEQVLVNLAVNARDAMGSGGWLRLATEAVALGEHDERLEAGLRPGDWVLLEVTDTGAGISEEVIERMFDPFYTTKPKGQGTGLGLATVYGIVAKADGTITVDSKLGVGTTFRVWLPRALHGELESVPGPARPEAALPARPSILLVEGEPAVAKVARRLLQRAGMRVTWAASGDEALRLSDAAGSAFDLLLGDVVMPGGLGNRLAERFRALHPRIPTLLLSGSADDVDARTRIGSGVRPLAQRPLDATALVPAVRAALEAERAARS